MLWGFCWGLVVFNLLIGYAVFSKELFPSHIDEQLLNRELWGIILSLLGISHAVGLITNNWGLMKFNLAVGLLVKSVWFFYILYLGFTQGFGALWGIVSFLLLVLWIQILANIHFPRED